MAAIRYSPGFASRGGGDSVAFFQIPAVHLDLDRLAHAAAQREDAGHEGQFTDGDAIHKALAAAKKRVVDGQQILAVLGTS